MPLKEHLHGELVARGDRFQQCSVQPLRLGAAAAVPDEFVSSQAVSMTSPLRGSLGVISEPADFRCAQGQEFLNLEAR